MHSTTKYLTGHSDAVGGALCVADASLAAALRADRTALGSVPGALPHCIVSYRIVPYFLIVHYSRHFPPPQRPANSRTDSPMLASPSAVMIVVLVVPVGLVVAVMVEVLFSRDYTPNPDPGSLEPWLLLRSLRTLHLRVGRQCATAAGLSAWLQAAVDGGAGHPLAPS